MFVNKNLPPKKLGQQFVRPEKNLGRQFYLAGKKCGLKIFMAEKKCCQTFLAEKNCPEESFGRKFAWLKKKFWSKCFAVGPPWPPAMPPSWPLHSHNIEKAGYFFRVFCDHVVIFLY